jgi:hypothetical protein
VESQNKKKKQISRRDQENIAIVGLLVIFALTGKLEQAINYVVSFPMVSLFIWVILITMIVYVTVEILQGK